MSSVEAQKSKGYNIVKAGKKLVGALSYFGGFSTAQPDRKVEQIITAPIINKDTDLLGLLDKPEESSGASHIPS